MFRPAHALLCTGLLLSSSTWLPAQTPPTRPWTLTIAGAGGWGGPSGMMGSRLIEAGFDDRNSCFIFCVDYPVVFGPEPQWTIAIGRRVGARTEIRTILGGGSLGWASGERNGARVARSWSSTTLGALLTLDLAPVLRLGAGPLLGMLRSQNGTPGNPLEEHTGETVVRPGLVFEAGLRSSTRKRLFLDISATYRLLSPRREGPQTSRYFLGEPGPELPPFDANYSFLTLGIGVGVRW